MRSLVANLGCTNDNSAEEACENLPAFIHQTEILIKDMMQQKGKLVILPAMEPTGA
jgi:hypothetical protein